MTDKEYKDLVAKIEREFPIRMKLRELAGMPKINPKNYNALMDFDETIAELFLKVAMEKPENLLAAMSLIKGD